MLTQMEVFTEGITIPPLDVVDQAASLDSIQIKNIDGLGPVKANVNTTQYGSVDGEFYNGSYTPKRNIILTISLNPNWAAGQSYESLRQTLYSYFMTETQVRLRFTSTHLSPVEIIGYVESCEPDMFSKDSEYQVSIICPQPYFTAVSATVVSGVTQPISGGTDVSITYEGSVDTGFIVDVTMPPGGSAYTGEVRLLNNTLTPVKIAIVTPVTVSGTQFFRLSSNQGDKWARQYPLPSGNPTNVLGKVSAGSSWLTVRKGINKLQILTTTAGYNWSLSYYAKYGGL